MSDETIADGLDRLERTFKEALITLEGNLVARLDFNRELLTRDIASGDKETMSALRIVQTHLEQVERTADGAVAAIKEHTRVDHEKINNRMEQLQEFRWKLLGGASVIALTSGVATGLIGHALHW